MDWIKVFVNLGFFIIFCAFFGLLFVMAKNIALEDERLDVECRLSGFDEHKEESYGMFGFKDYCIKYDGNIIVDKKEINKYKRD